VRGGAWSARQQGRGQHLLTTPIEHGAIGKTIDQLVAVQGFDKSLITVDHYGQAQVDDFRAACQSNSVLASVMYANNEVGTIEPITELARVAHDKRILFHTDAVQAAGQLPLNVQRLGVDLLSISGHKFYGPKGVGALYVRDGVNLTTAQTGGSHERGLRAGTHNTPLIVGLAKALELAYTEYDERIAHLQARRDQLITGVLAQVPNAILTGHPEERLPGHASFVFEQIDSSLLLNVLDAKGIAASAASACKTGSVAPSSVLLALGYPAELAAASLRLTVGIHTTEADIDYAIATIADVIQKLTFKTQVAV
jgi:cysteine desulfurase